MTESEIREYKIDCEVSPVLNNVLLAMDLTDEDNLLHLEFDKYKLIKQVVNLTKDTINK